MLGITEFYLWIFTHTLTLSRKKTHIPKAVKMKIEREREGIHTRIRKEGGKKKILNFKVKMKKMTTKRLIE